MLDFLPILNTLETEEQRITAGLLFEKYQNAMYWIAFNILKNDMDAEDAVMKAAENICTNIDDFFTMNENDTKLFVSSIVKNAAIDIYRKNKKYSSQNSDEYILTESDITITVETVCCKTETKIQARTDNAIQRKFEQSGNQPTVETSGKHDWHTSRTCKKRIKKNH